VKPQQTKNDEICKAIRQFMRGGEIELLPFTAETAEQYSAVRAQVNLKAADAIHAATAVVAKVDLFVTNDSDFKKMRIPGIPFFAGLDGKII
jgi:predicted nucleic acid-binding protein